jgi:hypothetical protein
LKKPGKEETLYEEFEGGKIIEESEAVIND